MAYLSVFAVMYWIIDSFISHNIEELFDGGVMTLFLTSPIWGGALMSTILHRKDLSRREQLTAIIPSIIMIGLLLWAYLGAHFI